MLTGASWALEKSSRSYSWNANGRGDGAGTLRRHARHVWCPGALLQILVRRQDRDDAGQRDS